MRDFKDLKFGRSRVQIVCWGSEIAGEFDPLFLSVWAMLLVNYATFCVDKGILPDEYQAII